jgi:phosphoenolpyruvate carboxykinase (GTP)
MLERVDGQVAAQESPIGLLPVDGALNVEGLDLPDEDLAELFAIDPESWRAEADATEEFFATFEGRVPEAVTKQLQVLRAKLS